MSFKNGEGVGGYIKAVSRILGQTDVDITLKIYHHVNAKSIQLMHREYGHISAIVVNVAN